MINAFLYGIYNQNMALPHLNDPDIQAYRHQWLEAAFAPGKIEAVVTFGNPAFAAWTAFRATPAGQTVTAVHHRALHPTADKPGGPITRKELLENWNVALQSLHADIQHPDVTKPLVPYGDDFTPEELPEIPSRDFPAGLPAWMRSSDFWAGMSPTPGHAAGEHLHRGPLGAELLRQPREHELIRCVDRLAELVVGDAAHRVQSVPARSPDVGRHPGIVRVPQQPLVCLLARRRGFDADPLPSPKNAKILPRSPAPTLNTRSSSHGSSSHAPGFAAQYAWTSSGLTTPVSPRSRTI